MITPSTLPGSGEAAAGSALPRDPGLRAVWELLETVCDPEIPVLSIVDLGVLREVVRDGEQLRVVITPTYSGCPAMRMIEDEVRAALERGGYSSVLIETRLSPAWTTEWMSEAGRARLLAYGIAPPARCGMARLMTGEPPHCPQCGSSHTRLISQFGSTACKSLHQCIDCREPFDYFKHF